MLRIVDFCVASAANGLEIFLVPRIAALAYGQNVVNGLGDFGAALFGASLA